MTADTAAPTRADTIPLGDIDRELQRQVVTTRSSDRGPVQWARMSNLVIYCDRAELAEVIQRALPQIVAVHPARVLLLVAEPGPESTRVTAHVNTWSHTGPGSQVCSEQVTLRARGEGVSHLTFAVRGLLIGDLPINVWWASPVPPAQGGAFLFDLTERAQQIIYDSIGWPDPARGVAATAAWLPRFEGQPGKGPWRVASDLNWRRLKFWRRLLAQALDTQDHPGALDSITEVLVEHGPHAVVQAWELVSWLAARLGWTVQGGRIQPNVEIAWQVRAPHGLLRVRIDRLADGPSELRRVRIACAVNGQPTALNVQSEEDGTRLSLVLEGLEVAARTVTVQPQELAELVARQLSDRERDPVFRESMEVAQVFAQSVLR